MARKTLLMAHPRLSAVGGGNAVAAWALQTLCSDFEITLATLDPLDCSGVNRSFGTCLRDGEFEIRTAPAKYLRLLKSIPTRGGLLEACLAMRWAQDLDRRAPYDVLLSTSNEMDFGRRGIQYVHYPWHYLPRPEIEMRWFHKIPGALRSYRTFCFGCARGTQEGLRRNLTIANSRFVAERIRQTYGTTALVVHPPVPGEFLEVPWEHKRLAMAAVGRFDPVKRWERAVGIVESVRERGHELELTLIGHRGDPDCLANLRSLAAGRPWFRLLSDLDRPALMRELANHRYGIHTMEEEHFGIAPAELQRAGCIPFVHNSGGPAEIVGDDPRLTFDDVPDAVEKISRVLGDSNLQLELCRQVAGRKELFNTDRFCKSMREIVDRFVEDSSWEPA